MTAGAHRREPACRAAGGRHPVADTGRRGLLVGLAATLAPMHPARARDRLRYGGDEAFAPFESRDAQGQPQGFQVELLAELGRLMDADIEVVLAPWARTEAEFRAGRLDLVALVETEPRRAWARYTRGHATPVITVYRGAARPEPQELQDLVGLRIAVLDHEAMQETLRTWLAALPGPFVRCADALQALHAVRDGVADVALLPRAYADPVLAQGQAAGVTGSALALRLQSYAFAVAPSNPALQARLQAALDELERTGRLEALRTRWLGSHRGLAERDRLRSGLLSQQRWTWAVAGASTLAVLGLAAGLWRRGRRMQAEAGRRREAEQALQRAEELLERTFVGHPEAMLLVDQASGVVVDANAALQTLLGVPLAALVGRPLREHSCHLEAGALEQLVDSLDREGSLDAAPVRLSRADGQSRRCLVSADRLQIGGVPQVFCLVRDITEQLERDEALRRGYDELAARLERLRAEHEQAVAGRRQAETSLQDFTRAVAHDLRGPLNAVTGFVGLLRTRLRDGHVQEALTYSEQIDRAARRMTAMVGALSSLAQVSRQPVVRRLVDMQRLVADTWALVASARPTPDVQLGLEPLPPVHADAALVAQVWQNLLDNARKYSARSAAPKVRVDSFRDARGAWYRVTDNGAGFDMAQAGRLFLPFQRMHSAAEFEGTGVGLSLVKRIVDHHGGEIRVRSAPGVGTVVEFTLDELPGG